jgi:hypothetical protein
MISLYSELQWLPRAPREFRERLNALNALCNSDGNLGRELQSLALHALDVNQLAKLAKTLAG